jgi:8-oxo-dGTP pyrophosphatase MutT (NUDIX family)
MKFDRTWIASLRANLNQPALQIRTPLRLNGQKIGSVAPGVLDLMQGPEWSLTRMPDSPEWHIQGAGTQALADIAHSLLAANIGCVREQWRNEQLAVCNDAGQRLATVERGMARLLGITTHAVHLLGFSQDGGNWVQQRAWNKSIDPGLWDTLVGGMISVQETLQSALKRETWEEAGLELEALQELRQGGHFMVQRPNERDAGIGYVVERIDWFTCVLPDGLVPQNQDGEVAQFALMNPHELQARLQANAFTLDAANIFLAETASLGTCALAAIDKFRS